MPMAVNGFSRCIGTSFHRARKHLIMHDIYIVGAVRTAIGNFGGALKGVYRDGHRKHHRIGLNRLQNPIAQIRSNPVAFSNPSRKKLIRPIVAWGQQSVCSQAQNLIWRSQRPGLSLRWTLAS